MKYDKFVCMLLIIATIGTCGILSCSQAQTAQEVEVADTVEVDTSASVEDTATVELDSLVLDTAAVEVDSIAPDSL